MIRVCLYVLLAQAFTCVLMSSPQGSQVLEFLIGMSSFTISLLTFVNSSSVRYTMRTIVNLLICDQLWEKGPLILGLHVYHMYLILVYIEYNVYSVGISVLCWCQYADTRYSLLHL